MFGNLVFTSQAAFANGVQTISLTAEAVSQSQIRLSWRITNPGSISLIRIYRADAASPQNLNFLTSLAANATIFVDQNLSRGTRYYYQVRTVAGGGILMSTPSNTASAMTFGSGSSPTRLQLRRRFLHRPRFQIPAGSNPHAGCDAAADAAGLTADWWEYARRYSYFRHSNSIDLANRQYQQDSQHQDLSRDASRPEELYSSDSGKSDAESFY